MRVAFVIPYFYPAMWYGGTPRAAYETARALLRRGHEVTVMTTDSAGPTRISQQTIRKLQQQGLDGIKVRYYRNISNNLAYRNRLFLPPGLFFHIQDEFAKSDIVHIHELRSFLTVGAHYALESLRKPFVLSPHGGLQHLGKKSAKSLFDAIWGNSILSDAAAICAISPLEARDARYFGVNEERIRPFPSPLNAAPFATLPSAGQFVSRWNLKGKQIGLFLGRLHWIKGPDILLNALEQMADIPDVHVVLAGPDDGAEVKLRNLVREKKLADKVTFTGFLDDTQKLEALMDSHVVAVPSRQEGLPIAMLEALACEKPVIASSACDTLEEWFQGRAALFRFRNEDSAGLAANLRTLLFNRCDPKVLSASRSFVLSEFSADTLAARAEALYESLL